MKILLGVFLSALSFSASSKTLVAFMGAGGEPNTPGTMFDNQIPLFGQLQGQKNWQTQMAFNGGHSKTEQLLASNVPTIANKPFTKETFESTIKQYVQDIQTGKITSGDQLMIMLDTHGSPKDSQYGKTHAIAVGNSTMRNLSTGEGADLVSLDRLDALAKLAQEKNIKLAIIDLSCHSGNTLALSNSHTCVISSAGPKHFGGAAELLSFPNLILKHLKTKSNLEEAFLAARLETPYATYPMISSPVGLEIDNILYEKMRPFLYSASKKIDKLTDYLQALEDKGNQCEIQNDYDDLIALMNGDGSTPPMFARLLAKDRKFKDLKEALTNYYNYLSQITEEYRSLKLPPQLKDEKFCSDWKTNNPGEIIPLCETYNPDEIIGDQSAQVTHINSLMAQNPSGVGYYRAKLDLIEKVRKRREQLLSQYPDLTRRDNFFKSQPGFELKTFEYSTRVAMAQSEFYQKLYEQGSKGDTRPNPCKDFKL